MLEKIQKTSNPRMLQVLGKLGVYAVHPNFDVELSRKISNLSEGIELLGGTTL